MIDFIFWPDLWANIIGGVITAGLLALIAFFWDRRKHRILRELVKIMGEAIKHRNIGEKRTFTDEQAWVEQAKALEEKAVVTARRLSLTAGSLLEWLDRVPPWQPGDDVDRYVSILSTIIERIRLLMDKNA